MDGGNAVDPDRPDNHDTDQDATLDERSPDLIPKLLIAPIAILIAVTMIGLPVMRILTADDDTTVRREAASDARGQVAVLFASAVLESRAPSIAVRYAIPELEDQIRTMSADLQRRDADDLRGAVARTSRSTCANDVEEQECFVAQLSRSGEDPVIQIAFVVGIVNGVARVIAIGDNTIALLGRDGRGG